MRRSWFRLIGLLALVAPLLWGLARAADARRFEANLARATREASAGRFAEAGRWFGSPEAQRSGRPEVAYWLGLCEHAAGRHEAAVAAWGRVPAGSPLAATAGLARAQTLVGDLGRFAEAEAILEGLLVVRGPLQPQIRHTLGQLYFWEGRKDAMRHILRDGWNNAIDRPAELRDYWMIDNAATLVEEVKAAVESAASKAPTDDRVWMAQAHLDVLAGHYPEAKARLDRCLERRPDDPAVWRARLEWARASGDAAEATRALARLPGDRLDPAERLAVRAWLAGRAGDGQAERRALERLIELAPGDTIAMGRLATLAWEAGEADYHQDLMRRKGRIDEALDRYRRLFDTPVPADLYPEMATLAGTIGRPFEAMGWSALAATHRPADRALADTYLAARNRYEAERSHVEPDSIEPPVLAASPLPSPTASVVVPTFVDDAEPAGLRFAFDNGRSPERQLPETTAGGVGLIDFDGDGRLDVYVLQGGRFPPDPSRPNTGDRLFRNLGNARFADATESSGISAMPRGYGHGVAVGDFDGDGHPDLFITRWRSYALLRNRGDGTFEDATEVAGLAGDRDWPTSSAFADFDNDGDLDLYVCHYLKWDADHPTLCDAVARPGAAPGTPREHGYCMPRPFDALPDHLFRNDRGRFVDVSAEAGIVDRDGRGLGVVAADLDDDGRVDLFVANDTTANYFFRNLGGMRFEEMGLASGLAANADGAFQAGMGTACGDLDGDGRPDLAVTNFYGESTTCYRNLGGGMFADETAAVGLRAASRFLLGFGVGFFDANNDGLLDMATANGHVNDERPSFPYAMPAQLLLGGPPGHLADASARAGPPWLVPRVARGLALGDLDNDGHADLLIHSHDTPLAFLHNRGVPGRSATFRLEGTDSNRDAVGAVVRVEAGGRTQVLQRIGGGSFQSASDGRLRVGLGDSARIDSVEIRWPSGRVERHRDLPAGAGYLLREGDPAPLPLPGFP